MATMEINGTEIWYADTGGDGEVILFHHGYTGSHDTWPQIIERMGPGRRFVMMDGRGAGDSVERSRARSTRVCHHRRLLGPGRS